MRRFVPSLVTVALAGGVLLAQPMTPFAQARDASAVLAAARAALGGEAKLSAVKTFIANGRTWESLPADLKTIVSSAINDAGVQQRVDIKKLNETLQSDLAAKGLAFNKANPDSFRAKLREAGFYAEWKGRFGDEAWGLLEQSVGKLA